MTLRIIGGTVRRRHLKTPSGIATRPYTDRVRQAVFDRLSEHVPGARVADVFAGVGTMGIEAVSRGAIGCVFYEFNPEVYGFLKDNVETLIPDVPHLCWKTNIHRTSFRPKGVDDCLPYSLIFFDPPYAQAELLRPGGALSSCLDRLARPGISTPDAVLVVRTPDHFLLPEQRSWQIADHWRMSTMNIWVMHRRGDSESATNEADSEVHESESAESD